MEEARRKNGRGKEEKMGHPHKGGRRPAIACQPRGAASLCRQVVCLRHPSLAFFLQFQCSFLLPKLNLLPQFFTTCFSTTSTSLCIKNCMYPQPIFNKLRDHGRSAINANSKQSSAVWLKFDHALDLLLFIYCLKTPLL
jgi:hypothetical protein